VTRQFLRATERRDQDPHAAPHVASADRDRSHVLQLQRAGGNAAVARMLATPAGNAVLARDLTGNPGDLPPATNPAGVVTNPGTVHKPPELADAANHGAPSSAVAAGMSIPVKNVKVKATDTSAIEIETPQISDLYEEGPASTATDASTGQPVVPSGFTAVDEVRGTVAAPVVDEIADNSIFIDPGPKTADVQQGGIGDCWDMATFIGIVNRDPEKIRNIMVPDGQGGASVTLHHRVMDPQASRGLWDWAMNNPMPPRTYSWKPETVVTSKELAFRRGAPGPVLDDRALRNAAGPQFGHLLRGAQLQAAERPFTHRWFAKVVGRTLEVHRVDIYQMARWAPLLEKAAARFSQSYGAYGGGALGAKDAAGKEVENKDPNQGYENLQGGYPGFTLGMFYGKEGEYSATGQGGADNTAWTPATAGTPALLTANAAAFDRLLTIAAAGPGRSPIVTARAYGGDAGETTYIPRLVAAIPAAQADPEWATQVSAPSQTAVTGVLTAANAWTAAAPDPNPMPPTGPPPGSKTATKTALVASAKAIANAAGTHSGLMAPTRSSPIKAMVDLLLIIGRMPGDTGGATRSVYSGHEYSVLSANIVMKPGAPGQITATPPAGRAALYPFVDIAGSTVLLMNPHHRNEPDSTGAGPADASNDGKFTVDLDRFFRLFAGVMSAEMATTPPPAP
jgi:hypothetical protein